jgi:hypothetical protein
MMFSTTTVSSYDEFLNALAVRVDDLRVTRDALNERAGLAEGYVGKIFGPRPARRMGALSLWAILEALGLKIVLVENNGAYEPPDRRHNDPPPLQLYKRRRLRHRTKPAAEARA